MEININEKYVNKKLLSWSKEYFLINNDKKFRTNKYWADNYITFVQKIIYNLPSIFDKINNLNWVSYEKKQIIKNTFLSFVK